MGVVAMIARVLWAMPHAAHNLVLRLTGWRIVRRTDYQTGAVSFVWSKVYPL